MNKERVIRRLEEIAQANFCSLFLNHSKDEDPNIVSFIFADNYSGEMYHMKINLEQISYTWSTAVERELAHRIETDRVKACKERLNSIYGTMGLKKPAFVDYIVPGIKKVIFNNPATIILWNDNTKTVVKAEEETFDPEKGMAMAIAKKALGNQGRYYEQFKKWLPKEDPNSFNWIDGFKSELLDALKPLNNIIIPKLNIGVKENGSSD